jgi:SAM-dependent methyltransferase
LVELRMFSAALARAVASSPVMQQGPGRPRFAEYACIGLVACSMLMHEILLTRVCALRMHFHFAFLVISNCLLGLGAAGSVLTAHQARFRAAPGLWLGRFSCGYLVALVLTYGFLLSIPMPRDLTVANTSHVLVLLAFNAIGAVPFFFSGLVIGFLLSTFAPDADRLYAVDLVGAGLGCLFCPLLLPLVGGGGVFIASSLLALIACVAVLHARYAGRALAVGGVLLLVGLALLPTFDRIAPVPAKPEFDPRRGRLDPGMVSSVWTANSRIDLQRRPGCNAPIFMLGTYAKGRLPKECSEIAQDATANTTISNFSQYPEDLEILRGSMYSAAYRLRPGGKVLVIGLGGGNDVWAAKLNGASSVRAIELNWPIVDIHKRVLRRYSERLVSDPSVQMVVDEGRSALMRDPGRYDVVQMTGIDTWTALASGAYVLAENYLYTQEAIASMYRHLEPGGIIQISRFAAVLEALRLMSNIHAALRSLGVEHVERSISVLGTDDVMMSVQIKKGAFTPEELASTERFAKEHGIHLLYTPARPLQSMIDTFLRSPDKDGFIARFPGKITPTEDDSPYFFNFARWDDPIGSLKGISDIPSVSQGNPFMLFAQLLLSALLSAVLIVWPLLRTRELPPRGTLGLLGYFSALGMGFILLEIAVIQKLTLLLGQPIFSLTVTLFSLLVFTGLGSLLFARRLLESRAIWLVPAGIVLYVALFNLGSGALVSAVIGAQLPVRITVAVLALAPIGVLLGIPFAHGLRVTSTLAPNLTPWAWAINGCLSVIGSILSVIVSMNFGFAVVLWCAAAVYALGFVALHLATRAVRPPAGQ